MSHVSRFSQAVNADKEPLLNDNGQADDYSKSGNHDSLYFSHSVISNWLNALMGALKFVQRFAEKMYFQLLLLTHTTFIANVCDKFVLTYCPCTHWLSRH